MSIPWIIRVFSAGVTSFIPQKVFLRIWTAQSEGSRRSLSEQSELSRWFRSQESEEGGQHRPSRDGEEGWGSAWWGGLRGDRHVVHPGREPRRPAGPSAGYLQPPSLRRDSSSCLLGFRVPSSGILHALHPSWAYLRLVNPLAGKADALITL